MWQAPLEVEPPFPEMTKVRVTHDKCGPWEGYVIASQIKDGRWIFKVSHHDEEGTFDNWYPLEWLERIK